MRVLIESDSERYTCMNEYICEIQTTTATTMLFVVIVIGRNAVRAHMFVADRRRAWRLEKNKGGSGNKVMRVCVGRWWMPGMGGGVSSFPPPTRRVPVPVPVPGILEPGKLPLCACLECAEELSVSGLGGKATSPTHGSDTGGGCVMRCRFGFMPLFGVIIRWVEAGWRGGGLPSG